MTTYTCRAIIVGAWVVFPWVVGCDGGVLSGEEKKLIPQQQLGSSDIPVPAGFEMDQGSSEDRSAGGTRMVRHVYLGKKDGQLVRAFYRDQMPLTKWTLTLDEMRQGQVVMQFEKELETCDINISEVGRGWTSKTKLRIEVTPRARGARPAKSVQDSKLKS